MPLFKVNPSTGRKTLVTRKRLGRRLPRTHCKTRLIWHSLTGRFASYEALVCPRCGKVVSTRLKQTGKVDRVIPTPIENDIEDD